MKDKYTVRSVHSIFYRPSTNVSIAHIHVLAVTINTHVGQVFGVGAAGCSQSTSRLSLVVQASFQIGPKNINILLLGLLKAISKLVIYLVRFILKNPA